MNDTTDGQFCCKGHEVTFEMLLIDTPLQMHHHRPLQEYCALGLLASVMNDTTGGQFCCKGHEVTFEMLLIDTPLQMHHHRPLQEYCALGLLASVKLNTSSNFKNSKVVSVCLRFTSWNLHFSAISSVLDHSRSNLDYSSHIFLFSSWHYICSFRSNEVLSLRNTIMTNW